jgi:hypothetical protein
MGLLLTVLLGSQLCLASGQLEITSSTDTLGQYEKLELIINGLSSYENPFDPKQVDTSVEIVGPGGEKVTLPAFYCQDYERRKMSGGRSGANWYYPKGQGDWKARFAPRQAGAYSATVALKDSNGTKRSNTVRFTCKPSQGKGYLRVCEEDPRFLELREGDPFIAIGQNIAFVGEGQYVNLTKAEEIFGKLAQNGANFVRIWTCCEDWAMAIEARKSAWGRSWSRDKSVVPMPDDPARKCVKIESDKTITVSPSHRVALRPNTQYLLTGRFMAEGPDALQLELAGERTRFDAGPKGQWKAFRSKFTTDSRQMWLGRTTLGLVGSGVVYVDGLSLKEAGGGAELLWEADVNRPLRGVYNQLDCFMLDRLVESARENGVYLMLCLITRDNYMKYLSDPKSAEYQQAIDDVKNLMRYAVARWGYSTSVGAWEYYNEIDPGKPTDRFYDEVGEYLAEIDVYHHLRTTSTWHPSARDIKLASLDIGQLHHYMRPETKEDITDEVASIVDQAKFLREHGPNKPVLIGEFGLADQKWGRSDYMKQDTEAVHFHNCLWASAFSGISGTAMFWWWEVLDAQDAYRHYKPLADFLSGVSLAGLQPIEASVSDDAIRVLGYKGKDRAYFWACSKEAKWWNRVVDKKKLGTIEGARVSIDGLDRGRYSVEWWDTTEGKVVRAERISVSTDLASVSIAALRFDIACKIVRENGLR